MATYPLIKSTIVISRLLKVYIGLLTIREHVNIVNTLCWVNVYGIVALHHRKGVFQLENGQIGSHFTLSHDGAICNLGKKFWSVMAYLKHQLCKDSLRSNCEKGPENPRNFLIERPVPPRCLTTYAICDYNTILQDQKVYSEFNLLQKG